MSKPILFYVKKNYQSEKSSWEKILHISEFVHCLILTSIKFIYVMPLFTSYCVLECPITLNPFDL